MTAETPGVFKPRMEILPPAQQALWPGLRDSIRLGFTLYGGTAIALRLGHRTSVDFDFFSSAPLNRAVINATFPFMLRSTVLQDQPNSLTVLVPTDQSTQSQDVASEPQQVKLSFFGTIGFGLVSAPDITDDKVLQVASLDELMATKLNVILQRAEAKDYRDISAMINAGISLAKGLSAAREMFGPNFQPSESLKAMVYFDDGDLQTLTQAEKTTLVNAVSRVRDLPVVTLLR
jgi:Nucleotidyl transferase AbiEii toxin, Type IV TA system